MNLQTEQVNILELRLLYISTENDASYCPGVCIPGSLSAYRQTRLNTTEMKWRD